jgi:hypothetical protein
MLALKALETPSLVSVKLTPKQIRRLNELSRRYARSPLDEVTCVLFDTEEQAEHWIRLRHTGQNKGRGLVAWGPSSRIATTPAGMASASLRARCLSSLRSTAT